MKRAILLLLFATSCIVVLAQRVVPYAGLFIRFVYIKTQLFMPEGDVWVNRSIEPNEHQLSVKHFLLNTELDPQENELPHIDPKDYNLRSPQFYPYALFLPPHINEEPTRNHRVLLTYGKDTMIVDFLNIPDRSFNTQPSLEMIQFKPGKFVYNFIAKPELSPKEKMETAWLNFYLDKGITPESEPYLIKYGVLTYTPPSDIESTWKYVVPQLKVEQTSPYVATIRLEGNFLGKMVEGGNVIPYSKVEIWKNDKWVEKPVGIGLEFEKDSNLVSTSYYDKSKFLQLTSTKKQLNSGFEPCTYRVTMITDNKREYRSPEFTLGILPLNSGSIPPNINNPYQNLCRENTGFPNYKLDANNNINIVTPFSPIMSGTGSTLRKTHHFRYFWIINRKEMTSKTHPEDEYMEYFISLIPVKKVNVNGMPYSGRIKFAFNYLVFGVPRMKSVTNIYTIEYVNGAPVSKKILEDVDLRTEATPRRP